VFGFVGKKMKIMSRYCFATLAVNEPYETKTKEFYKSLKENTMDGNFFITTTNEDLLNQGNRIYTKIIKPYSLRCTKGAFDFNLHLKCLSLKHVLEMEKSDNLHHDYVIFTDGDWGMYSGFTEEKILNILNYMENNDIDCLFERPAMISDGKLDPENCFYKEKLYDYDVFSHTKWDDAHCVNEQFFIFKNNSKFRFFVQRWEQFLWYTMANDIRNYPDGFEIGISILESGMNYVYKGIFGHFLPECFYFYTKNDIKHIRF
jgi:hypothetical protein